MRDCRIRNTTRTTATILVSTILAACASIPGEAPELSAQLGTRISAMENAHQRLLQDYFKAKRHQVDEFIQEAWVPAFAQEFFNDPAITQAWNEVVASRKDSERLKFMLVVAPALQAKINNKRTELMQPLDALELAIAGKLTGEYDGMRAINSTLTAFLQSAADVEANRKRYLELAGINDSILESFIDETDQAVAALVSGTGDLGQKVEHAKRFESRLQELVRSVRNEESQR
jgi:hypothetical protein